RARGAPVVEQPAQPLAMSRGRRELQLQQATAGGTCRVRVQDRELLAAGGAAHAGLAGVLVDGTHDRWRSWSRAYVIVARWRATGGSSCWPYSTYRTSTRKPPADHLPNQPCHCSSSWT